jgi:hypothetical protein
MNNSSGLKEWCCDYYPSRKQNFDTCPVVQHGSDHIYTDCRECAFNEFDFYTTLAICRKKMSLTDPIWIGIKPIVHEEYVKERELNTGKEVRQKNIK